MQEIFQYTYIAGGIWKEDLRSLLWARAFKQPLDSYQYFAPSSLKLVAPHPYQCALEMKNSPTLK
jgi:hypothetical protein